MKKTALYFGSFNPIHIGHLIIAEYVVENTEIDEVWFVISPSNPLKKKESLLSAAQRYYMTQIAIEDDPRFKACDVEFNLPYPSYTCVTLAKLTEQYPDKEFVIVMGEDNLKNLHKWRNYEYILENFQIIVYPRPDSQGADLKDHPNIHYVAAPLLEISATQIRDALKNHKTITYLLPPKVKQYIDEMGVYRK
jgi:nicotinate-nucleotide adenylyltransferase